MTKEKTVEIACKIETPADLEDLDHLQCAPTPAGFSTIFPLDC